MKKVTVTKPKNKATAAEQAATSAAKNKVVAQKDGMLESDKLIYKLVEDNIAFLGEQLHDNLSFNSKTLADVLYENIEKLLNDKMDSSAIVKGIADLLL